jgi:nucleoside recognition membrane protein YjiH
MEMWNLYFWLTFFVTFLVTAITVRIWPLSKIKEDYYEGSDPQPEKNIQGNLFAAAWAEARKTAEQSPRLLENVWVNLKDGLLMAMAILPSILSIGLLGLVLAEFTPVFDWIGYIFYPFTSVLQLPEPLLAAKASALGIAEMFLPALLVTEAALELKIVIAVVSVSGIIFFSALVPCIVSTEIPLSIPVLIVIWIERVILTLIIAAPLVYLLL